MRVIHWYPGFVGGGGVANAVGGLASAEAALGVAVTVVARALDGAPLAPPPALHRDARLVLWRPRAGAGRLQAALPGWAPKRAAELARLDPEIVHLHGEFHPEHLYAPRLWPHAAYVVSPHGGFHPAVLARGQRQLKRAYLLYARRSLYRRAALHALSPLEAEHLAAMFPGATVQCIHNGPGREVPESVEPAAGVPGAGYRFVYVGRLNVVEKGLDLALQGLAAARRAGARDASLVLVGPDWAGGRAWIAREAERLGIADRVHALGAVDPAAVPAHVAACDCFLQPARNDGFGLAVAEALLVGRPALISDIVGAARYPELTAHPHLRVCATTAESVTAAMLDVLARGDELAVAARDRLPAVRAFLSWETVARRHVAGYRALTAPMATPSAVSQLTSAPLPPLG